MTPTVKDEVDDKIAQIMNNQVKEALGIDGNWGEQSDGVSDALYEDFMTPVISAGILQNCFFSKLNTFVLVESILNDTDIQVAVYNGQLDLIVDTPGKIQG